MKMTEESVKLGLRLKSFGKHKIRYSRSQNGYYHIHPTVHHPLTPPLHYHEFLGDLCYTRTGLLLVSRAAPRIAVPVGNITISWCRTWGRCWKGGHRGGDCDSSEEEGSEHAKCVHCKRCLFVCGFISRSFL
jgi:hypothetical protein